MTGIGFLGAGLIVNQRGAISGPTIAAGLWATAAVGMASAYGMYVLAVVTALLLVGTLALRRHSKWPAPHPQTEPVGPMSDGSSGLMHKRTTDLE